MKSKTIRDPIHGTISLSELELKILDTPQMQRLRHIKQNGLCYLVYPAMNSTRFEHSLGVMHLAGLVADNLALSAENKELIKISGLLHDVGHSAFSHTSDHLLCKSGHSHEENSSRIIQETVISEILIENGINPKEVSDLIKGNGELSKLLSSEIDVDKMDYLIRDSYYAGVAYGMIDLERIIYRIKLMDNKVVLEEGSLEAVESLLISRNLMYQTVYRHHTKRILEEMFRHALEPLLEKIGYEKFIKMDDINLVYTLRNSKGYSAGIMRRIDERKLFKTFFQEKIKFIEENFRGDISKNQKDIEKKISDDFGIDEGNILVDMPETKMEEFKVLIEENGKLKHIDEVSSLAKSLERSEEEKLTFSIYAPPEELPKLEDFNAEKYIEFSQTRLKKFFDSD